MLNLLRVQKQGLSLNMPCCLCQLSTCVMIGTRKEAIVTAATRHQATVPVPHSSPIKLEGAEEESPHTACITGIPTTTVEQLDDISLTGASQHTKAHGSQARCAKLRQSVAIRWPIKQQSLLCTTVQGSLAQPPCEGFTRRAPAALAACRAFR